MGRGEHDAPDEIPSGRLLLRALREDDAGVLHQAAVECLAELVRRFPNEVPELGTPEGAREYVRAARGHWVAGRYLEYGVFMCDGEFLGAVTLECDWDAHEFDASVWLRPRARGSGHAFEALSVLLEVAFQSLDARQVTFGVDPDNAPCLRLVAGLGLSPLPTLAERGCFVGTPEGACLQFGITRERWAERTRGR